MVMVHFVSHDKITFHNFNPFDEHIFSNFDDNRWQIKSIIYPL